MHCARWKSRWEDDAGRQPCKRIWNVLEIEYQETAWIRIDSIYKPQVLAKQPQLEQSSEVSTKRNERHVVITE